MNKLTALISHVLCISLWLFTGCSSGDEPKPVDCNKSDLDVELVTKANPTSCTSSDGTITVVGSGGKEPYTFAINAGSFSSSPTFNSLGAGTFEVQIKDKNGCEASVNVSLIIVGENQLSATLVITSDTECLTNNGTIQVNASGGVEPYQYRIGSGAFGDGSSFGSLAPGTYSISVKDSEDCIYTVGATVSQGPTGITYDGNILAILQAKCNFSGCHPDNGDWFTYSTAKSNASAIKTRTRVGGGMPKSPQPGGDLTSTQRDLIACWVDGGAPE